jgi:hypothetical protein
MFLCQPVSLLFLTPLNPEFPFWPSRIDKMLHLRCLLGQIFRRARLTALKPVRTVPELGRAVESVDATNHAASDNPDYQTSNLRPTFALKRMLTGLSALRRGPSSRGVCAASGRTAEVSMVAVSWDGSFQYAQTECASKNHRLILTRR